MERPVLRIPRPLQFQNCMACPFCLHDKNRYEWVRNACTEKGHSDIGKLNEHIKRVHTLPLFGCPGCKARFHTASHPKYPYGWINHDCKTYEEMCEPEWMTTAQHLWFKGHKTSKGKNSGTNADKWAVIYNGLFPDAGEAPNPYQDYLGPRHVVEQPPLSSASCVVSSQGPSPELPPCTWSGYDFNERNCRLNDPSHQFAIPIGPDSGFYSGGTFVEKDEQIGLEEDSEHRPTLPAGPQGFLYIASDPGRVSLALDTSKPLDCEDINLDPSLEYDSDGKLGTRYETSDGLINEHVQL